jgi:hypothetical protein
MVLIALSPPGNEILLPAESKGTAKGKFALADSYNPPWGLPTVIPRCRIAHIVAYHN